MKRLECSVGNCYRQPYVEDDELLLCERHAPDPHTRSWAEMKAEGIEIETMGDYAAEVRGFHDPEPYEDF